MPLLRGVLSSLCLLLPVAGADWNTRLAAEYLDARQKAWFAWPRAAKPGGPCMSCHTGVTYLLARPALRRALHEEKPTAYELGLLDALRAPVTQSDPPDSQAAGVYAVLAAFFFPNDQRALDRFWELQMREGPDKGAWRWFSLKDDPWEMPESIYYGAALASLAISRMPDTTHYAYQVRELANYLRSQQASQPLHNRLMYVWAASKDVGIRLPMVIESIENEVWSRQEKDGGWAMQSLGPFKEHPQAPPSTGSNAYATALVAFVLEQAGIPSSDTRLERALAWLRSHQDPQGGYWDAPSMNHVYPPDSMPRLFMRDAATAYAVLALLGADSGERVETR